MRKSHIAQLEGRIQQLVEGNFARLFAGRLSAREVAMHLARALDENAFMNSDGALLAPNSFIVALNSDDHDAIIAVEPTLAERLTEAVVDFANRAGMHLRESPLVTLVGMPDLPPRTVSVAATFEAQRGHTTKMLATSQLAAERKVAPEPLRASLIIHGTREVSLERAVINIGRQQDNHVVLDDGRVSRKHAQLRLRFGHYVLYDLGSSGGTSVNDHAVTETILKSGDVISLAGVILLYVEDSPDTPSHPAKRAGKTDDLNHDLDQKRATSTYSVIPDLPDPPE